jgi:hypothetical protein
VCRFTAADKRWNPLSRFPQGQAGGPNAAETAATPRGTSKRSAEIPLCIPLIRTHLLARQQHVFHALVRPDNGH